MNQLGKGVAGGSPPGRFREAGWPGLDAGTSRFEGFSHPAHTSGIQGVRSPASTRLKPALRNRKTHNAELGEDGGLFYDVAKGFSIYSNWYPRNPRSLITFSYLTNTVIRRREPLPFFLASFL
jgi:hypothetical protein